MWFRVEIPSLDLWIEGRVHLAWTLAFFILFPFIPVIWHYLGNLIDWLTWTSPF